MIKRKAETLVEIITAMAIFGVMLGGICDFMSNQTANVAYIMKRDDMMFAVQEYQNRNLSEEVNEEVNINGVSVDKTGYTITAKKGNDTMTFNLKTD